MANIPAVSSRQLYPGESIVCNEPDFVIVAGSFETANGVAATNIVGTGFQVNYVSEGKWDITFSNLYPLLVSITTNMTDTAGGANDDTAVTTEPYSAVDGTMVIKLSKESTDTLTPADVPGARVNFIAVFHRRNSLAINRTV